MRTTLYNRIFKKVRKNKLTSVFFRFIMCCMSFSVFDVELLIESKSSNSYSNNLIIITFVISYISHPLNSLHFGMYFPA